MVRNMEKIMKSCCFIGHRKIKNENYLELSIARTIEKLIKDEWVDTFILGSNSEFDTLCKKIIFQFKEIYPKLRIINFFCGNEKPVGFDEIYYPPKATGRYLYIERNKSMIDESDLVVFYFNTNLKSIEYRSGTRVAYNYALYKNKSFINLYK